MLSYGPTDSTLPCPAVDGRVQPHDEALEWAKKRAEAEWGPIELESPRFDFTETKYYDSTMGPGLKKVFFAFEKPFDPADLVDVKLLTNQLGG